MTSALRLIHSVTASPDQYDPKQGKQHYATTSRLLCCRNNQQRLSDPANETAEEGVGAGEQAAGSSPWERAF